MYKQSRGDKKGVREWESHKLQIQLIPLLLLTPILLTEVCERPWEAATRGGGGGLMVGNNSTWLDVSGTYLSILDHYGLKGRSEKQ